MKSQRSKFPGLMNQWIALAVAGVMVSFSVVPAHATPAPRELVRSLASTGGAADLSERLVRLLETEAGRFVLFDTDVGHSILNRSLGEGSLALASRDITPLLERLRDPSMSGVAERLETNLARIESRFRTKTNVNADEVFSPGSRRALTEIEINELRRLATSDLRIDLSFFPSQVFSRDFSATRQFWVRAIEADLSAGARVLRYPKGVDPLRVRNAHLRFGFESEYTLETSGRLLSAYGPATEFGISASRWQQMRAEERVEWVRSHMSELFTDTRTPGKLVRINRDPALNFLPENLILDSTGNLDIVVSPADTFEEWLSRVTRIEAEFGAGSMQGTVGMKSEFFHNASGVEDAAVLNQNLGWLNVMNEMDTLAKLESGAERFAVRPDLEVAKSFKHPYLGPMTRMKQVALFDFLTANSRGERLDPRSLEFVSGNDSSFKYIGGMAYRPDIARGYTIFEVRDAHNQVGTLVERVIRATYYLQYGREPFSVAARLRAFDSIQEFARLPKNIQRMLRDVFPPRFEPGVQYREAELRSREYFRNFAYPMRDWSGWRRLFGSEVSLARNIQAAQIAYMAKLESVASRLNARTLTREQASVEIQGALAQFSADSDLHSAFSGFLGKTARGDQAWARYMDLSIRELGPLKDAFPRTVWEGSMDTRLARFKARWENNVKLVDDVGFSFTAEGGRRATESRRRVLLISTKGMSSETKALLIRDYTDAFSRGTVSFPVGEQGGHLFTRIGNQVADYAYSFNLRGYEAPYWNRRIEPFMSLNPQEELRLRFYIENASKNSSEVVGSFSMDGAARANTRGNLRDNRPISSRVGHNCTSWMCTSRIGDGDERLLELAGARVSQEVHTNPGWWLYFLTGAGESSRIPFVAVWDGDRALSSMARSVRSGQDFPAWNFAPH
jgi:hypothetical protein